MQYVPEPSPTEQRDRALDRLRRWTWGIAVGAIGLVGLFAIMAAASFPGRSSNPSSGSASTGGGSSDQSSGGGDDSSQTFSPDLGGGSQPQAPNQGFFGSGSGGGRGAVSGGS